MKSLKKKKTVKGMTLIEIIISIVVLGIAGTLMCAIGASVTKTMIQTNHLNNKTETEAPIALARDKSAAVNAATAAGETAVEDIPAIKIHTSDGGFSDRTVGNVKKYTTKSVGDTLGEQGKTNMSGDLVFYTIG